MSGWGGADRLTGTRSAAAVPEIRVTIPLIMVSWIAGGNVSCVKIRNLWHMLSRRGSVFTDCTDLTSVPGVNRFYHDYL